jgi:short subunit dehydrogenase-like uncharacterized protein
MLEGFYVGTVVREQGKIRLLNGFSVESRLIRGKPVQLMGIAWGDVSSAYYSTGIPNIRVFLRTNTKSIRWLSLAQKLRALWKLPILQSLMKAVVEKRVAGPSIEERESSHYEIWGTVRNMRKEERTLGIRTQNGYSFTVDSALLGVEKILSAPPKPGAMTPSMAFGAKFATEIVSAELMR